MKILLGIAAVFTLLLSLRVLIPIHRPTFKKMYPYGGIKMYLWNMCEALLVNGFVFYAIYKIFFQ